ncbi:MAG: lysophospholipid acyltransferase family protein [Candidatus Bipolaricaulota bacterium]|nr:lysophospholipid acyltransferase family protein [Candidatus Bipolaricaulota bacterium]
MSIPKASLYTLVVLLSYGLALILFRVRVKGREVIERSSGYITVARHRSYWDIPLLAVALGWRNRIHFIARKGLARNPLLLPFVRLFATVIDRSDFHPSDFKRMLKVMQRERLIAIFPEGTTRMRVQARAGAIHFAKLTGKALLPVNIRAAGPYPPQYPFRFPRVTISIGNPVFFSDLEGESEEKQGRAAQYRLMTERLMERVDTV